MEKGKKDFLQMVCVLYMSILLVWIPLCTGGSYYHLGDTKYMVFRNVSLLCMGLWITVAIVRREKERNKISWSIMDSAIAAYGGCVVLSALCSPYKETVWLGYEDWYMGALSQLLFIGIYFMVSRYYPYISLPIVLGEGAFAVVVILGFLNRLEIDPLRLYATFLPQAWEYSHMISTVGNINWFCGYAGVMLAFPITGYLYSKKRKKTLLLYLCTVLGLVLLCMQGSAIGPVLVIAGLGICLVIGLSKEQIFQRTLLLGIGVCVLFSGMGWLITFLGTQAATPTDGDIYAKMLWSIWWVIAFFQAIIYFIHKKSSVRTRKAVAQAVISIGICSGIVILLYGLWKLSGTDFVTWGSGRGGLWKAAWLGFCRGDLQQKLLGAGSDCFGKYIYTLPEAVQWIRSEGYWENAVFANAHNEVLTQLINLGLVGTLAYLSIFVCGLKRYRGMLLGILAIGMYGINALVGFQQVMNGSLLFLILGICENRYRAQEE